MSSTAPVDFAPSADEQESISTFINEFFAAKSMGEKFKQVSKEMRETKKILSEQIEQKLVELGKTCVPVTIADEQLYVRRKQVVHRKDITQNVIIAALEEVANSRIDMVAERLMKERATTKTATPPTIMEVLTISVIESCKEHSTQTKNVVLVDRSKERVKLTEEQKKERRRLQRLKKRGVEIEEQNEEESYELPEDVYQQVVQLYEVDMRLRKKSRQVKQKRGKLEQILSARKADEMAAAIDAMEVPDEQHQEQTTEAEGGEEIERHGQVISEFLQRVNPNKLSSKISIQVDDGNGNMVDKDFFIRQKKQRRSGSFPIKELDDTVKRIIDATFEQMKIDKSAAITDQELATAIRTEEFMLNLCQNIIDAIKQRKQERGKEFVRLTLDKARQPRTSKKQKLSTATAEEDDQAAKEAALQELMDAELQQGDEQTQETEEYVEQTGNKKRKRSQQASTTKQHKKKKTIYDNINLDDYSDDEDMVSARVHVSSVDGNFLEKYADNDDIEEPEEDAEMDE